jgi:hypothetical protein
MVARASSRDELERAVLRAFPAAEYSVTIREERRDG